jgi:hypothetical protein
MTAALLHPLVADAVREHLGVTLPSALRVPWHGDTYEERAVLLRRAWDELAPQYPVGTQDDLDPFVRDAFQLLAHPEVSVELVVGNPRAQRDEHAVAVTDGGFALIARYDERGLMLEAARPTGLAPALVGLLPPHPVGRGHSASAPTDTLRRATDRVGGNAGALERELIGAGVHRQDAEVLAGVLTAKRLLGGQLSATGYEQHGGRPHIVGLEIGFIDTEHGRYFSQNRPADSGDGTDMVTIAPADGPKLVERISEMVRLAYGLR